MGSGNPFLDGSGGGQIAVNNGEINEIFLPPRRGSAGRKVGEVVYTPIEKIKDLPFELYAKGDIEGFKQLNDLVKNAGFTSFEQGLQAAALDPDRGTRTWQQYFAARAADPQIQALVKESGGNGGVSNSTSVSTDLSSRSEAANIADANFRSQLGRTASKQEIMDFQEALNEQQSQNPSVTQSRTVSGKGSSSSNSTTTGGFDYTRFARQYAQQQPEFKDRYAAITFMDILDSAISDPNSIDALVKGSK